MLIGWLLGLVQSILWYEKWDNPWQWWEITISVKAACILTEISITNPGKKWLWFPLQSQTELKIMKTTDVNNWNNAFLQSHIDAPRSGKGNSTLRIVATNLIVHRVELKHDLGMCQKNNPDSTIKG